MFDLTWSEKESADFSLTENIDSSVFEIFLVFLYTDRIIPKDLSEHRFDLYQLADFYGVDDLKQKAVKILNECISDDNIVHYIRFMKATNSHKDFEEPITDYIALNYKELVSKHFPFHKLGKLIDKVFNKLAKSTPTRPTMPFPPGRSMPLPPGCLMPSMLPMLPMPSMSSMSVTTTMPQIATMPPAFPIPASSNTLGHYDFVESEEDDDDDDEEEDEAFF